MSPIPGMYDGIFYIHAEWQLCRIMWPRRCEISGRRLWPGTLVYRGSAAQYGTSVVEYRWHDQKEHLLWQLKE